MKLNAPWHVALLAIASSACGSSGPPATPLFAGVDGMKYDEGTRLIQSRLEARFPAGSSGRSLEDYLGQQGLRVEDAARASPAHTGTASLTFGGGICGSQVRVNWATDAANQIQRIRVLYGDTGCP